MKANYDSAQELLFQRITWEQKQRTFYTMRHNGLPRVDKPFPTAADAHYPLIDMTIRRLKPFWLGQLTTGDRLFEFTSLKQQLEAFSDSAAAYMDFVLTQQTELMRKTRVMIDHMLLKGRGVLKVTVDPMDKYKLVVAAIDPFFILMPQEANGFEDADEFVHVRTFTVEGYKRLDGRWDTSDDTVDAIRGQEVSTLNVYVQQKRLQEGITYTDNVNKVIVWEHWKKTSGGHTIYTYSPLSPDLELRKPYGNPYKVGGDESVPYFGFQMEVTDEGWYAPRGLAELLAPLEQYMTKLWNEKADYITFSNRPLYTGEKEITNASNLRWRPGEYIPGKIQAVQQSAPPINFDQEIGFASGISEQQSQSPDFGIVNQGDGGQTGGKPRTATENQRIAALQQAGGNDNAMMFREDWSKLGRHCWGLICQFQQRDFSFFASGEIGVLPEQARHDEYMITVDGAPDGWNRQQRIQKAMAALQSFQGNPNVDPELLTKNALMAFDSRMALKAFIPSNLKGASEYEDEAMEILLLTSNPPFPVTVQPQQDQLSRIKCIIDWMHAAGTTGVPVNPAGKALVHQNLVQRIQILQKQNPAAAKQIKGMLQQLEQAPMAPQGQQQPQLGSGAGAGQAMPQPSSGGASQPPASAKESISIAYRDAPEDIKRQMEKAAGFVPSVMPPQQQDQNAT